MGTKDDGGPAFPHVDIPRPTIGKNVFEHFTGGGMSLRDFFAIHASDADVTCFMQGVSGPHADVRVRARYDFADAMLAARKDDS